MKVFVFLTVLFNFFAAASADFGVYKLEVERNGQTHLQVAGNFWQGEYPGPVIDVNSKKKGRTTIQGWASLRKLNDRRSCTIKNGLYHPWSASAKSLINYYTIAPAVDYVVTKELTVELTESFFNEGADGAEDQVLINPGDLIVNFFYLSEGQAVATLVQGGQSKNIFFFYDTLEANPEFFKAVIKTEALDTVKYDDGTEEKRNEQWLYLNCKEGYKVFVQDSDILSQKGVKEGTVTGYGEIEGAN